MFWDPVMKRWLAIKFDLFLCQPRILAASTWVLTSSGQTHRWFPRWRLWAAGNCTAFPYIPLSAERGRLHLPSQRGPKISQQYNKPDESEVARNVPVSFALPLVSPPTHRFRRLLSGFLALYRPASAAAENLVSRRWELLLCLNILFSEYQICWTLRRRLAWFLRWSRFFPPKSVFTYTHTQKIIQMIRPLWRVISQ